MNVIFSGAMCRNYSHRREQDPTFGGDKKNQKHKQWNCIFRLHCCKSSLWAMKSTMLQNKIKCTASQWFDPLPTFPHSSTYPRWTRNNMWDTGFTIKYIYSHILIIFMIFLCLFLIFFPPQFYDFYLTNQCIGVAWYGFMQLHIKMSVCFSTVQL